MEPLPGSHRDGPFMPGPRGHVLCSQMNYTPEKLPESELLPRRDQERIGWALSQHLSPPVGPVLHSLVDLPIKILN